MQFTLGSGELIAGFDQAVVGMRPGDLKRVTVLPEMAHGRHRAARVQHVARTRTSAQTGSHSADLGSHDATDQVSLFTVVESPDASNTRDYNHPLAGKVLLLDIELLAILPTTV